MDGESKKVKWYLRPVSVILLLFFVLGPFALPLLYKSPHFSKTLKILLTIVVVIYTAYLIFVSFEIGREVYKEIEELQEISKMQESALQLKSCGEVVPRVLDYPKGRVTLA